MDEAEFDEFYAASYRRLCSQVYAMIGDLEEARDCVQEAFVKAWAHRRKLDRADHPEAWVRLTAHRLAISRWRRTMRGRRAPDRALTPDADTAPVDADHVVLVEALKQLPEAQRHTIVLHHIADLPVHAVALELGVAEGTVKARLARGRAALAVLLADQAVSDGGTAHA
jgi:RNA polymerase sigma-70 factor, ECF subfamily